MQQGSADVEAGYKFWDESEVQSGIYRRNRKAGVNRESAAHVAELTKLFNEYSQHVAQVCTSVLGPSTDTQDLVQDVFLRAYRGLTGLRNHQARRAWLSAIAVREAVKRKRKQARQSEVPLDASPAALPVSAAEPNLSSLVLAITRVLERQNDEDVSAFYLYRVHGLTIGQVAQRIACSESTTKRRIRRTERALAAALGVGLRRRTQRA